MFLRRCTFLILGFALAACAVQSEDSELTAKNPTSRQFAETVILGAEYGQGGSVNRFARSPRLSVFNADTQKRSLVQWALSQINAALGNTGIQVQLGAEMDRTADILVYYAPMSQFAQIARDNGFEYAPGNSGFFWMFWNNNHEVTRSVVMIATDVLSGLELASVTLEEITQCLGAVNDQSIVKDSIFYETPSDSGFATQLGRLDRSLLHFLYGTLSPGQNIAQVDYLFSRYWVE